MKFLVVFVALLSFSDVCAEGLFSRIIGIFTGWFPGKDNGGDFDLEAVQVVTKEDMNRHGAMRAHLVIVYDNELRKELRTMTSYRYFRMVDQLIKDYPDKMKIYSWNLIAVDRIRDWQKIDTLKNTMSPFGGFIFADYHNSMMAQRAEIPNYKKIKIIFGKDTFAIDYEDKELVDNDITEYKELGDENDLPVHQQNLELSRGGNITGGAINQLKGQDSAIDVSEMQQQLKHQDSGYFEQ